MKEIQLTQGKVAIVDDEDFEYLSRYKWQALIRAKTVYAQSGTGRTTIMMHRLILSAPKGKVVDHINGDGLDNRKENMRICSVQQNIMHSKISKSNTSGYKGVKFSRLSSKNPWLATIGLNRKEIYLGIFPTKEVAAQAYDVAARKYFGKFAYTNTDRSV